MPKFYFRFQSSNKIDEDPNGLDLPDLNAAREEAIQAALDIVGFAVRFGIDRHPDNIIIFDGSDRILSIVPLADALPRRLRR
jgi:hypothetical protein